MQHARETELVPVFLSGAMGTGKTTVGRVLASRLGVPFVDLDARISAEQGASVSAIFASQGEAAFRRIERDTARRVVDEPGAKVVALGGGTVIDRDTRRMLLARGVVVTLRASASELARRLAGAVDRPLLAGAGDATTAIAALLATRASAYAESAGDVDTEGGSADDIAASVLEIVRERPVPVALGERTYRVEIGRGVAQRIGARLAASGVAGQVVVVGDRNVEEPWARQAREHVRAVGLGPIDVTLTPGEAHKTIAAVESIWDAALAGGIDRRGAVVAVGGGVVGDLAGFAASTLLRGVTFAQLPTSLLAMVDASVGGKTGFDRSQGKNLVGSFHQPCTVICDVDALSTLAREERISGLAEVVKSAWIDGEDAVAALERDAAALVAGDPDATLRAVRSAVSLKARIVAEDELEQGPRALLNLGHTLGHAMEAASAYSMRHGDAVARGMVAAMRIARALSAARAEDEERLLRLLASLELPCDPEAHLDARALGYLGADKKRAGASVRFVVPAAPGGVTLRLLPVDTIRGLVAAP